ncbi:LysR family transcriptional regulator [Mangrovicoccus algicola]|uniref:LysR family transcriptional regulator n=1 Tax=Mangrovicoccus algicola TaxID=2771008 RepID=A0A8J7CJ64_9RHOB|nr:LysR family transcriptional regulator [Mangrovicoccus algicola]MBE3637336.1 LysR family transcriptional regulator [Mangrovicoccus algicola]
MDLRPLRHFAAVAEELHFGRAADRLGMTQPPLSQSIQALERRLGAPLFARTRRSVALTPFGAAWLPQVQAALAAVEALEPAAERILGGQSGRLELSFVSTADYSILPRLVHRFRDLYPEVELALSEATTDRQVAALAEGRGQAGIVILQGGGLLPEGFSYLRLLREPLIAAVPETWITQGRLVPAAGRLAPAAVTAAPLILFPRRAAPYFHDLVTGYYEDRGARPRVVQHAIQMQTIISLVSAGMGIALVPGSLRSLARAGVRYLDLGEDPPHLETGLIWRRDDPAPVLRNFLRVVADEADAPR